MTDQHHGRTRTGEIVDVEAPHKGNGYTTAPTVTFTVTFTADGGVRYTKPNRARRVLNSWVSFWRGSAQARAFLADALVWAVLVIATIALLAFMIALVAATIESR